MRRVFPNTFYNIVSLIGAVIAAVSFGLIIFLMVLESFDPHPKPYMGIIAFVILPVFLLIGVALIIIGILREHRRERQGKPPGMHMPVVDLNNPRHRAASTAVIIGAILLLMFSTFGSYQAYEYTDSDQFCGEICHKVMKPEYTAYQYSPHARVGCAECHIGPGADWFVRSKISGSYQVYATIFNKYPKPIGTPIKNLRPAQQTCEQCHWPRAFYSEQRQINTYFMSDTQNTKWTLNLLMKIGGGSTQTGPTSGIHWHMNINNEVTYAALDTQRQVIPWVQAKRSDGTVTVYRSTEITVSEDSLKKAEFRRMDCIDCHNRPTHIYHPSAPSVNLLMSLGWIDPALPGIKALAVKALDDPYTTEQGASDSIRLTINDYYKQNYPNLAASMKVKIDSAVEQVQRMYSRNYFPEMNVSWKKFPDNLGHMYFLGCFRCHDGKHVNDKGQVLSRDCNTCHTILAEKVGNEAERVSLAGIDFKHPVDIGDAWQTTNCSDCHFSANQ